MVDGERAVGVITEDMSMKFRGFKACTFSMIHPDLATASGSLPSKGKTFLISNFDPPMVRV